MASRTYIRFSLSSLAGPVMDAGAAIPPGQPSGVALTSCFETYYDQTGVASASKYIFNATGSSQLGAAKSVQSDLFGALTGQGNVAGFLGALATPTKIDRVCSFGLSPAAGGIATPWVNHYVLLRDAVFTSAQLQNGDDGTPVMSFSLTYTAAFWAFFATPSGGALGTRTAGGWDWNTNTSWNGG